MSNEKSVDEAERRRKVVEEKAWGALIERVERMRKKPEARSIFYRLYFLNKGISESKPMTTEIIAVLMRKGADALEAQAPSIVTEQTNFFIKTYNSIVKDIHSHLGKKDSYITEFSSFEELNEPTMSDIIKNIFMMEMNIRQITSYMLRWLE